MVLHYTAMASADAAIDRLCDEEAQVSAHYLISKSGDVVQMVAEGQRAWHAGAGEWAGQTDMNSRSIGIELDNNGNEAFPNVQMQTLEILLDNILVAWGIQPENVIGHSDMAPGRKSDPGPWFDWTRLEAAGLARKRGKAKGPVETDIAQFVTCARQAGYTAVADPATLLTAVRLRYRPFATGPLEPADFVAFL